MLSVCERSEAQRSPARRFQIPGTYPSETPRSALLQQLAETSSARITVLLGPSGYGKSTLLAQSARQIPKRSIWIHCNEDDQAPATFLTSLIEGCRALGLEMPHCEASDAQANRDQRIRAISEDLNDAPDNLSFFLDDAQQLSVESSRVLTTLIGTLTGEQRFFLATRSLDRLPLASFIARGQVSFVDIHQLKFHEQELQGLARHHNVRPEQIGQIAEQFQGWPAAVLVALHSPPSHRPLVISQLMDELLWRLPDDLRVCLPALCGLDVWSEAVFKALHLPFPVGGLSALIAAGLPLSIDGHDEYRPHELLRNLLREQLGVDPAQAQRIYLQLAEYAVAQGQPYRAMQAYRDAYAWPQAAALAETLIPTWYLYADWLLVRDTVTPLPSTVRTPALASLLALALIETSESQHGEQLAKHLVGSSVTATPTAYFALSLVAFRSGEMQQGREWIDAGLAIATGPRDRVQLLRGKAAMLSGTGTLDDALMTIEEAIVQATQFKETSLMLACLGLKGHVLEQLGRSDEALVAFEHGYQSSQHLGFVHRMIPIVMHLIYQYRLRDRLAEAEEITLKYLKVAQTSYPLGIPMMLRELAGLRLDQGRVKEGLEAGHQAFECWISEGNRTSAGDVLALYADQQLATGDVVGVQRAYGLLYLERPEQEIEYERDQREILQAKLALAHGQTQQAQRILEARQTTLGRTESASVKWTLLLAEVYRQLNDPAMLPLLHQAVQTAHSLTGRGTLKRCLDVLPALRDVCEAQGWQSSPSGEKVPAQTLTLRIQTLGSPLVLLGNVAVALTQRTLELLVYLVLESQVQQDVVADALWEDVELKRSRGSARSARYRLNELFGDLPVVVSTGRGLNPLWALNDQLDIECDVRTLLHSSQAVEVERLYVGAFLSHSMTQWAANWRDIVDQHVMRVFRQEAHAQMSQDARSALRWLVKASQLVPSADLVDDILSLARGSDDPMITQLALTAVQDAEQGEWRMSTIMSALN